MLLICTLSALTSTSGFWSISPTCTLFCIYCRLTFYLKLIILSCEFPRCPVNMERALQSGLFLQFVRQRKEGWWFGNAGRCLIENENGQKKELVWWTPLCTAGEDCAGCGRRKQGQGKCESLFHSPRGSLPTGPGASHLSLCPSVRQSHG